MYSGNQNNCSNPSIYYFTCPDCGKRLHNKYFDDFYSCCVWCSLKIDGIVDMPDNIIIELCNLGQSRFEGNHWQSDC